MIMTGMVKLKCHLPDFFLVDKELDVDIQSTCSRIDPCQLNATTLSFQD